MKITIVGAGPRGLAVALYAIHKKISVTLIDPNPLETWSSTQVISNLEMRSPITFDLVTGLEELKHFRLSNYLGKDIPFYKDQYSLENNTEKTNRFEFYNYLEYVYQFIKSEVEIIKKKVINVKNNLVTLEDMSTVISDAVIFCLGQQGKISIPNWLENLKGYKRVNLSEVLNNPEDYKNKQSLVVGSGQGAAEVVNYLIDLQNFVYWGINKKHKIYQYPTPDCKSWGNSSALGEYYSTLTDDVTRLNYLEKVKKWQPSITPYIYSKLKSVRNYYEEIYLDSFKFLSSLNIDFVILSAGVKPSIKTIPTDIEIPTNPYLPEFPEIKSNFKINMSDNSKWYVSGILAMAYDGPRQGSLISAGMTAKNIIENIINDS